MFATPELEMITFPTDNRKEAFGFKIGDIVRAKIGDKKGIIIGFGPAMHSGCTVKIKLFDAPGNMGDHHACGNRWIARI